MKKHIPQIVLLIICLFRCILPVFNVFFVLGILSVHEDPFIAAFMLSMLFEVILAVFLAAGFRSSKARRVSAYLTFGVTVLHLPIIAYIGLSLWDGFVIYCILAFALYAGMVTLAIITLRTVSEMIPSDRTSLPPKEIRAHVETLHDKLDLQ